MPIFLPLSVRLESAYSTLCSWNRWVTDPDLNPEPDPEPDPDPDPGPDPEPDLHVPLVVLVDGEAVAGLHVQGDVVPGVR